MDVITNYPYRTGDHKHLVEGKCCCLQPDYFAKVLRKKKIRQVMASRVSPDEKGYYWTMGYNNCVARYSQGYEFDRFSGSSYNRSLKDVKKNQWGMPTDLFEMATALSKRGCPIPLREMLRTVHDYLCRDDPAGARSYLERLSQMERSKADCVLDGLCLPFHILSARSRGKIKDKATAFFRACPRSRTFVTLTFLAETADYAAITILNKFLTVLRKELPGLQYLWVAERQENGNIHFHMIVNKRIPIRRFNALWVLQQYNSGVVGKNRYGESISKKEVLQRFQEGTVHKIFNPLDVKKITSIAGLAAYLTAYITKPGKKKRRYSPVCLFIAVGGCQGCSQKRWSLRLHSLI